MTATRAMPQRRPLTFEPTGMNAKLTAADIAKLIADSVEASLRQAIQLGCTADQAPAIAKAIGGNAGMVVYLEALERGIEAE